MKWSSVQLPGVLEGIAIAMRKNEAQKRITKCFRRMKILLVEQQKSVAMAKRIRFFTTDGATKYFSKWRLEKRLEIRATIEPDSQDVFCRSSSSALCLM